MISDSLTIAQVRDILGMTQSEFADFFGIPIGTVRNWEQGKSKAPDYVYSMIFMITERDKMINIETIKFNAMLNELASKTLQGIKSFKDVQDNSDIRDCVVYDPNNKNTNGTYKIVLDACIDICHHDAVSYYGYNSNEYEVGVRESDFDEEKWIEVKLVVSNTLILIEKGRWYID